MDRQTAILLRIAPVLFTLIWSTGFVAARAIAPYAEPLTILLYRYTIAAGLLLIVSLAVRARWPVRPRDWAHALICGVFLHALYLGGVWWAVRHGVSAGVSGLITALQPILTAALAPWIVGERLRPLQLAGIATGFAGIGMVLGPTLSGTALADLGGKIVPLAANVMGAVGVTLGTIYQKRFIPTGDLRTVTMLQYCGAFIVTLPAALLLEHFEINWNATVVVSLAWSVLMLSIGAIGLLLLLLRHGAVARAAALSYLVPVCTAVEAFFLFGEQLTLVQIAGMCVTAAGVAMIMRRPV